MLFHLQKRKKSVKKKGRATSRANIQTSNILVFVRESDLLCYSCICWVHHHTCCDVWIWWVLRTLNLEYRFHDIKLSINAYKFLKLWVWFDSTHLFEYSLFFSVLYSIQLTFSLKIIVGLVERALNNRKSINECQLKKVIIRI